MGVVLTTAQRDERARIRAETVSDDAFRGALRRVKKENKYTQFDIADISELSLPTVSKIFDSTYNLEHFTLATLRRVCHALGVKLTFTVE